MTAHPVTTRKKGRIGHSKSRNGCPTCKYDHFSSQSLLSPSCSRAAGFGESSATRGNLNAFAVRAPVVDATTKLYRATILDHGDEDVIQVLLVHHFL